MEVNKIQDVEELRKISSNIRRNILRSLAASGSGHTGGSLGLADVFTCLYFSVMNHNPQNPQWEDRDRLILSIGHVAPVLYSTLAQAGYFPEGELLTLRKLGSRLQGHPGRDHGLPGIELSAGSLGQGLSVATGMALAAKYDKKNHRIFCVMGDGELQEGSVWEAAMSASHYRLDNLCVIVDRNKLQIDGSTSDVMEIEPLADKWQSFGWKVIACNGNDHEELLSSFSENKKSSGRPVVIIANTLMGKGVKAIEDNYRWHGKAPSKEEAEQFIAALE
ncbi:MAG TPA: transketolase [Bacteroidales bacterium]|nr:transketolase [Bacteroidales bacterium]HPI30835.1 transketolase [Bacteroidales bacterium]HQN16473.1 transketolase [Bacteroidales bacterium]HQP16363.1 transketolase [Bacteroidales bacterium]